MASAGKSPALRSRRRRSRGWSKSRKEKPPPPLLSSPEAAAAAIAAPEDAPLPPGTAVEVRVDADGFHGSWFEATVVDFSPARGRRFPARYTVTYSHLLADDDGGVLVEHFAPSHIRPRPPPPPAPSCPLRLHDIVEAFHNDGWWSGIVFAAPAEADPDAAVTVAFPITREVISFQPHLVRPRRDYVAGEWVPSRAVVAVRPKRAVKAYEVGEKVEVGRDREEFGYSWFPATVAKVVDPLSYIVEYFDLELDGDAGAEKATEYLHWHFIRPAVEHEPRKSEFRLGPGTAVEAYCDGAWSLGIVRRVVADEEYEVSIDGKKGKVLVTKVVELLKPQYKWNGKQWRIVSVKRQASMRRRSMSGRSPSSPVDVASRGDEHSHDGGSFAIGKSRSATKRKRKEQQQGLVLADGLVDVSISDMDISLATLCKLPERNHSPYAYSLLSGKNNLEVIPNIIGQTGINQEILSGVLLDSQLNTPTSGTGAGNACDTLSIAELRKKMSSARRNSGQQAQERLLSVKALKMKKDTSNSERGQTRPTHELQGKHDASDNSQLTKNGNLWRNEVVCALTASVDCQASSTWDKQVSRQTRSPSNKKVPAYKKSKKKQSKELSSPRSSLDVDSTFQHVGRENLMRSIKSCTQQYLDRSLEDTYQELLPLIPPGFESIYNGEGIRDSLLNEELNNGSCQANRNGCVSTDHAAIQVDKSSQLMDAPMLSLDIPIQQGLENYQNAGSSQLTSTLSGHPVPFDKISPAWAIVEASDAFKLVPQRPHFCPLQEYSLEMREGMALGMTVAFTRLVENIREASIEESMDFFVDKINTLGQLESNGFNVQFLKNRLAEILRIKSDGLRYLGKLNKLDAKMVGKKTSLSRKDALLDQKDETIGKLELQLARVRQEAQQIQKDRENEDAELSRLKSKRGRYLEAYGEAKRQFRMLLEGLSCSVSSGNRLDVSN